MGATAATGSATANLGSTASTDTVQFASLAEFVGGFPEATINFAPTVTVDNNKLVLISAKRVNLGRAKAYSQQGGTTG